MKFPALNLETWRDYGVAVPAEKLPNCPRCGADADA